MISEKQKEFIREAHHRINLKIGARRCGKTYLDILYTIPKRLLERKNKEGLNVILGVSKGTIERNVLQPLREIYGSNRVSMINSQNISILFEQEVYCLGAEKVSQVSKIQGTSIKYLYGDEIARWNVEVFMMVLASLDKAYSCFDGALNPENKNHWLKKDFLDKKEEKGLDIYIQHYTIFDNPFLSEDFVKNLCNEYQGTVYYNRLILGQWCNAEGIIFQQIANDKERYLIDKANNTGLISIGIDFGGNKSPHAFVASKIQRDFSKIEVLKSIKINAKGTNIYDISNALIEFIQEIIFEHGKLDIIFADCAEQTIINTLNANLRKSGLMIPVGEVVKNSVKNKLTDRIKGLSILLNTDKIKFLRNKTEVVIEALQTAVYDEKTPDVWQDDGTSDIDSLDALVYSFSAYFNQLLRR